MKTSQKILRTYNINPLAPLLVKNYQQFNLPRSTLAKFQAPNGSAYKRHSDQKFKNLYGSDLSVGVFDTYVLPVFTLDYKTQQIAREFECDGSPIDYMEDMLIFCLENACLNQISEVMESLTPSEHRFSYIRNIGRQAIISEYEHYLDRLLALKYGPKEFHVVPVDISGNLLPARAEGVIVVLDFAKDIIESLPLTTRFADFQEKIIKTIATIFLFDFCKSNKIDYPWEALQQMSLATNEHQPDELLSVTFQIIDDKLSINIKELKTNILKLIENKKQFFSSSDKIQNMMATFNTEKTYQYLAQPDTENPKSRL